MQHHITRVRSSRTPKALWLLLAILFLLPSTTMANKKRRGKAFKKKRPAATAPANAPAAVAEPMAAPQLEPEPSEAQPPPAPTAEPMNAASNERMAAEPQAEEADEVAREIRPQTDELPAPEEGQRPDGGMRIRAGVNGGFTMFFPGPSFGGTFSGRAGVGLNEMLAVYVDAGTGFAVGGGGSASQENVSISIRAASYWRLGIMGEANVGIFFVSAGPMLFRGAWGGVRQSAGSDGASQEAYAVSGFYPAAVARAGFKFGKRSNKFTLALETMGVLGQIASASQSTGADGTNQSASTGGTAFGFFPALIVGWDLN